MAWRYCEACGNGQSQITVDDLAGVAYDEHRRVPCDHCGVERSDDTDGNRILVLVEELVRMRTLENLS